MTARERGDGMRPLGKHQRDKLLALAAFGRFQVVACDVTRSLVKRGLLREWGDGAFVGVTAAGLRAVADELDSGRLVNSPTLLDKPSILDGDVAP